jgi:hypothetical protein
VFHGCRSRSRSAVDQLVRVVYEHLDPRGGQPNLGRAWLAAFPRCTLESPSPTEAAFSMGSPSICRPERVAGVVCNWPASPALMLRATVWCEHPVSSAASRKLCVKSWAARISINASVFVTHALLGSCARAQWTEGEPPAGSTGVADQLQLGQIS